MNKDKRNNIKLLGTLNNADESGIIANANQIYDANENKSTQDVSKEHKERIETLETKENSMQTTLENITKTGEASAASNVTYNHSDSKLDATNVQQAVDEVRKKSNYNDGDNIIDFNTIHIITDNPEFAIAAIDINDRILYGIKADGQPYWGVGVPKVVRNYVDKQVNDILGTDNITETIDSLKEVEKFLSDFKNSDTLKALLDTKANKTDVDNTVANINADIADKYKKSNPNDEEGNVIDTNSIKSVINNPEYFKAFVDNTNKLIEAIGLDGVRKFFAGINIQGISQCVIDNPDYLIAWVDKDNKIIFAIQHDGNPYFGYGVPKVVRDYVDKVDKQVNAAIGSFNAAIGSLYKVGTERLEDNSVSSAKADFMVMPNVIISWQFTPNINTQYGYISFGTREEALYITTAKGKLTIDGDSYKTEGEYRAYFKDGTTGTTSSIIFIYIDTIDKKFVPRGADKVFKDTQSRYILLGSVVCAYTSDGSYKPNSFKRASFPFEYTVNGKTPIIDNSVTTAKLADNAVTESKIADNAVTEEKIAVPLSYELGMGIEATTSFASGASYPWYNILSGIELKKGDVIEWSVETADNSDVYWMATRDTANNTIQNTSRVKGSRSGVFTATAAANIFAIGIRQISSYTGTYKIKVRKIDSKFGNLEERVDLIEQQNHTGTGILDFNPEKEVLPVLKDFKHRIRNASFVEQAKQLVLLQLTDQHGDETRMNRAMQFASKYGAYIDDVIHTGDLVYGNWANGIDWFANVQNKNNILQVIGNHDVLLESGSDGKVYTNPNDLSQYIETSGGVGLNKTTHSVLGYKNSDNEMVWVNYTDIYGRYIAPYVNNWGVIQPSNAATQGLNYYYKDYTEQGIRLIVLDCMMYDTTQNTWLVSVLADAKTNGYGVIIAEHYPIQLDGFEYCAFTSSGYNDVLDFYQGGEGSASTLANAQLAVDNFMNAGGEFICWLAGHTHKDFCGTLKNYPKQVMFVSNITGLNHLLWGEEIRTEGTKTEDCFSVIAVDRYKKIVRIYRVGNQWDRYGRHKVSMAFDYRAAKMVYSS